MTTVYGESLAETMKNRTDREVGISPGEIIADKLRVPYFWYGSFTQDKVWQK